MSILSYHEISKIRSAIEDLRFQADMVIHRNTENFYYTALARLAEQGGVDLWVPDMSKRDVLESLADIFEIEMIENDFYFQRN